MLVLPIVLIEIYLLFLRISKPSVDFLFEDVEERDKINQSTYQKFGQYISEKEKLQLYKLFVLVLITSILCIFSMVITNKLIFRILFILLTSMSFVWYKSQMT